MARRHFEPPEIIRRLIKYKPRYPDAFHLLPHAIYYALISMPMPWEESKLISLVYHIDGSISIIKCKRKYNIKEYKHRWNQVARAGRGRVFTNVVNNREVELKINEPAVNTQTNNFGKIRNKTKKGLKGISSMVMTYLNCDEDREKHAKDILLFNYDSYFRKKLKRWREKTTKRPNIRNKRKQIWKKLLNSPYFHQTKVEWVEGLKILLIQAYNIITQILYIKKLSYIKIDRYFNINFNREVTTKERKKGRLGTSIRLICEILKLLRYILDAHEQYKTHSTNVMDLCATLNHIFRNSDKLTGMYRYKYKIKRQIEMCKAIKAPDSVWAPYWRIWCHMMRGHIPLLERYAKGLLNRMINGRVEHKLGASKQRSESMFDIKIKEMITTKYGNNKRLLQHFNEAWRCWRADRPYNPVNELGKPDESLIRILEPFCSIKAKWYIDQVKTAKCKNKKEIKKYQGKVLRLYMKNESFRAREYLKNPFIDTKTALDLYQTLHSHICNNKIEPVDLPGPHTISILEKAIKKLTKMLGKKETEYVQSLHNAETLLRIRKALISKRCFASATLIYFQNLLIFDSNLNSPVLHKFDLFDLLCDTFLEIYLWDAFKFSTLFPNYFLNSFAHPFESVSVLMSYLEPGLTICHFSYQNVLENIDIHLLRSLLRLILSPILVDYIISRINSRIEYKDMSYINVIGVLASLPFSSFISAFWLFSLNLHFLPNFEIILQNCFDLFIRMDKSEIHKVLSRLPSGFGHIVCNSISKYPFKFEYSGLIIKQINSHTNQHNFGPSSKVFAFISSDSAVVQITANKSNITKFKMSAKDIVRRSNGSSFIKIVNEWNNLIKRYIWMLRETAPINEIRECENAVKRAIMKGTKSKMAARFPAALFHAPRSLGGLGMIGVGKLVKPNGLKTECKMRSAFNKWKNEFLAANKINQLKKSKHNAWMGCSSFEHKFIESNSFKLTRQFKKCKYEPIEELGGKKAILNLTLWQTLRISDEEDISKLWSKITATKGTHAEIRGRHQINNRKFMLWWSPAINRSSVFMGYEQKIELTNIKMFGKLCSLKLLFVQIFREKLWKKIYIRICELIPAVFNNCQVSSPNPQAKRCYGGKGGFDLLIESELFVCKLSFCGDNPKFGDKIRITQLKINLQLVWSDMDSKSIQIRGSKYFHTYHQNETVETLLIMVDLCFGTFCIYGYCNESIYDGISTKLAKFIEEDQLMQIMRERIIKTLTLEIKNTNLMDVEVFTTGYICEFNSQSIFILNTKTGILYYKEVTKNITDGITELAIEVGTNIIAVPNEDSGQLTNISNQHGISVRKYDKKIELENITKITNEKLKKTQNVYFKGVTNYTSYERLKMILKTVKNKEITAKHNIKYCDGWADKDENEWQEIESEIRGESDKTWQKGIEWKEDYLKANERIKKGELMKFINEKDIVYDYTGLIIHHNSIINRMSNHFNKSNNLVYGNDKNEGKELIIPVGVLKQFRIISNTDMQVVAYIQKTRPFTVAILPQFKEISVELPDHVGIIANVENLFKKKLEIIVNDKLIVRGWHNNNYFDINYKIVDAEWRFFGSDWNYNFRISEFTREYHLKEGWVLPYYSREFRTKKSENQISD